MRKFNYLLLIVLSSCFSFVICFKNRDIISNEFKDKIEYLEDITVWRSKLRDDFKQNLQKLPENVKKSIVEKGEEQLKNQWQTLLAMEYLDFKLNGNRDHYEHNNFERHKRLGMLTLAEVLTGKGRYLTEVANGLWLLLEESAWEWPAHMVLQKAGADLPDPHEFILDIGAGDVSGIVAWAQFLLGYHFCLILQFNIYVF